MSRRDGERRDHKPASFSLSKAMESRGRSMRRRANALIAIALLSFAGTFSTPAASGQSPNNPDTQPVLANGTIPENIHSFSENDLRASEESNDFNATGQFQDEGNRIDIAGGKVLPDAHPLRGSAVILYITNYDNPERMFINGVYQHLVTTHTCSATLVGPNIAVTAGHCLYANLPVNNGNQPLASGAVRIFSQAEGDNEVGLELGVYGVAIEGISTSFEPETTQLEDTAVILTSQPTTTEESPNIRYAPITKMPEHLANGAKVILVGSGNPFPPAGYPPAKFTDALTIDDAGYQPLVCHTNRVGSPYRGGARPGDSGGGVFYELDGAYEFIGVHSRGISPDDYEDLLDVEFGCFDPIRENSYERISEFITSFTENYGTPNCTLAEGLAPVFVDYDFPRQSIQPWYREPKISIIDTSRPQSPNETEAIKVGLAKVDHQFFPIGGDLLPVTNIHEYTFNNVGNVPVEIATGGAQSVLVTPSLTTTVASEIEDTTAYPVEHSETIQVGIPSWYFHDGDPFYYKIWVVTSVIVSNDQQYNPLTQDYSPSCSPSKDPADEYAGNPPIESSFGINPQIDFDDLASSATKVYQINGNDGAFVTVRAKGDDLFELLINGTQDTSALRSTVKYKDVIYQIAIPITSDGMQVVQIDLSMQMPDIRLLGWVVAMPQVMNQPIAPVSNDR